ncbi:MAG: preprotein translocase subunit SecA [Alphaproteobacteria bacterium]|nr:preprotein translocase subunit SecA [Alphaproteobacteria bacterium]
MQTLTNFAKRLFGDANDRELKRIDPLVRRIKDLEPQMQALSEDALRGQTAEFKKRIANGQSLDDLLPEAFATVREVGSRLMGMRHFDSQMIGGIVLHQGKIAEMKTGEGKTLVATLPVYLNALSGEGAHVVTVNDYLARRDADWMRTLYEFLGLSVGVILQNERNDAVKRAAYQADITYGTNNEFGFDYLRDNMKFSADQMVQRGHAFGIVDEVDSILIDEARTPLIISGPMNASIDLYSIIDAVIPLLQRERDFTVDEKAKSVSLTDDGITRIEERLGISNLYDPNNMEVLHHVNQSLKAHHLFRRDRDYVVRDGEVVIVDEFTGRLMHGRRWSDGLHQAVEAKEKVDVQQESQTYATITFQNLFRMYKKLAGMTGTAATEAAEFASIYNLDTVVIPTNRPIQRLDHEDVIYKTQMEKFRAVVNEIEERNKHGQPILVGTTSVERSEIVSRLLQRKGIKHEVLNAKNHAREAEIVAQAGRLGGVTISTNMAGRGTDIKLGGDAEKLARAQHDPEVDADAHAQAFAYWEESCKLEKVKVLEAGGLFIIGTERHESRRVDNQLRGRSGRQGDPGGSRFYLSLEDDLLRIFGSDKVTVWMERMGLEDDEPIEHRWITRAVENAQIKVEGHNFNIRKNLLEYDDVMNYQRKGVYEIRRRALKGDSILEMVRESLDNIVQDMMDDFLVEGLRPEHWNIGGLRDNLKRVFEVEWTETDDQLRDMSRDELRNRIKSAGHAGLDGVVERFGDEAFRGTARMLLLQFTDSLWKDHLLALDRLRQGVGLRGYGQRNPLLEYKREALQMYLQMSAMRDEMVVTRLFHMDPAVAQAAAGSASKSTARKLQSGTFRPAMDLMSAAARAAKSGEAAQPAAAPEPAPLPPPPEPEPAPAPTRPPQPGEEARLFAHHFQLRRNDPCPCGSGKKFKKCCYDENWVPPAGEEPQPDEVAAAADAVSEPDPDSGVVSEGMDLGDLGSAVSEQEREPSLPAGSMPDEEPPTDQGEEPRTF